MKEQEWFADVIYTNVSIKFNWKDRIRILFGRTSHCDIRVKVEIAPGRCESESTAWVEPIYKPQMPGMAQAVFAERKTA